MKSSTKAIGKIDRVFRAFSDWTRLRILSLLQSGECCVGDLVDVLGIEQPSASRHLAYLRKAGLVVARKEGQWSFYALAAPGGAFHQKLLECLVCCFDEAPQIQKDRTRAKKLQKAGGCCPEEVEDKAARKKPSGCCG
jgi:ArsR family transcriptional regulator